MSSPWEVSQPSFPHSALFKDISMDTNIAAKVVTCQPSNRMEPTGRKDNADVPELTKVNADKFICQRRGTGK